MTTPAPEPSCPNCGKPIPPTVTLCPNCGANIPPLPEITNRPSPNENTDISLLTKSRGGDTAVGIVSGVLTPPILSVALTVLVTVTETLFALYTVALALFLPSLIGIPFGIAYALKRKYYVAGNAMQKALFGWLILIGLLLLGLLALCLSGNLKI
jgi:hypothetical protein